MVAIIVVVVAGTIFQQSGGLDIHMWGVVELIAIVAAQWCGIGGCGGPGVGQGVVGKVLAQGGVIALIEIGHG